jgi:hypothetical protein
MATACSATECGEYLARARHAALGALPCRHALYAPLPAATPVRVARRATSLVSDYINLSTVGFTSARQQQVTLDRRPPSESRGAEAHVGTRATRMPASAAAARSTLS